MSATASKPKLLFASYHCLVDPASGAASATRDLLELLVGRAWQTSAFCGTTADVASQESVERRLRDQDVAFERRECAEGEMSFSLYHFRLGSVPGTIYSPAQSQLGSPTRQEGVPFLALYERILERQRPDVLLTYGGQWVCRQMMELARRRNIAVVFALHNFSYHDRRLFKLTDATLVPSHYGAEWYHKHLGLEPTAIASPIDWARVQCEPDAERRYVTFVNPQPAKGVFVFARIALELGLRRPDISLLVVEGRGRAKPWLEGTGVDLSRLTNLHRMVNTPDPRDFYRVSRLLLMPSLCHEAFGRVAAEALLNRIPVLTSDRGALLEVAGTTGLTFGIPSHYTSDTRQPPTAEEVAPWVDTIIRLWDDDAHYKRQQQKCLEAAQSWRPERLVEQYDAFFRQIAAGAAH